MDFEEIETKPRRRLRFLIRILVLGLVVLAVIWFALPFAFQLPPGLAASPIASPVLLDRHGEPIRHLTSEDFTRSSPVRLSQIPSRLIDCTLAAEDKRFYSHDGIDIFATIRSASDFLRNRRVVSGASTITQQLAKITAPPARRNLISKFREAMIARRLAVLERLERLERTGKYSASEIALAREEPLRLRPLRETKAAPWLSRSPGSGARSTLDLSLQTDIERIVREETAKLKESNLRHAAVVVIDNAITPEFTIGVWAGNFENQPMKNISGVPGAGPIFFTAASSAPTATHLRHGSPAPKAGRPWKSTPAPASVSPPALIPNPPPP